MQGDVIIVEERHRRAAEPIAEAIAASIAARPRRTTITVAGESGSGKSETAQALAEALESRGLRCAILQQDDYFVRPPKSNDAARREDITWVGIQEVRLDLLDSHLEQAREGAAELTKPLVIYAEDRVDSETLSLEGVQAVIAEGTYTTALEQVDTRIFIDRNRLDTMADRERRGREPIEPFIERVLQIEHEIIGPMKARADVIITRNFEALL
jgi:uridine kinase